MRDPIERQAAIDALRMDIDIIPYAKAREYARAVIETVYNRLEELPSAQPQWISVTERMPRVGQTVICQCRADILELLKLDSCGDWFKDAEHVYMSGFVLAWMPLPEPYKERREE